MGVQIKAKKVQSQKEKSPIKIPYFMLEVIIGLIGKFPCKNYEEFEFIKEKREVLGSELQKLGARSGGDNAKATKLWQGESELSKDEFAWMEGDAFKALVPVLGLNAEQIGVLAFWCVKEG